MRFTTVNLFFSARSPPSKFLINSYQMGARSAENVLIYQLIFLNRFLTNRRAQRGNFFNISIDFLKTNSYQMGARSAGNFLIYQLIFWIFFFVEKKILRVDSIQKTFGRDAFYYCKTAFFCKIAPHFKKHSAAMHFTIVKLPFSARSPPAQILCVDKIRFSAEVGAESGGYRIEV